MPTPKPTYSPSMGITQSMLTTFMTCRYKSKLQLQGWKPLGQSDKFDFGEILHRCIENYYASKQQSRDEIITKWREEQIKLGRNDLEQMDYNAALAEAVWQSYPIRYAKHDCKMKWIGVEQQFDVDWNGYRLRGKLDGIFSWSASPGDVWLLENKTKGQITEDTIEDLLEYDFQVLFYTTVLRHLGYNVKGCLYNIIRKPQLRLKKTEIKDEFIKRVAEDVLERPDHYMRRYEISISNTILERFQHELSIKLQHFTNATVYHNEAACLGRTSCQFCKHCATESFVGYIRSGELFVELKGAGEMLKPCSI